MTAQAGGASPTSLPAPPTGERNELRRRMRSERAALTKAQLDDAGAHVARIARACGLVRPGRRIAVYLPYANEVDVWPLIAHARRCGCELFLPVITDFQRRRMQFRRFAEQGRLLKNRYGILEPAPGGRSISVRHLDVVFAPLVAVDSRGARLGSGAGFYDRSLQHLRAGRRWRRPRLIGLAYEFQRIPHLDMAPWDVPLDGLVTERAYYRFPHT